MLDSANSRTRTDLRSPQHSPRDGVERGINPTLLSRSNNLSGTVRSLNSEFVRRRAEVIVTASPARKTPVRDAVTNANSAITKVVTRVSDSLKHALSGGKKDDDNNADGGEGAAH